MGLRVLVRGLMLLRRLVVWGFPWLRRPTSGTEQVSRARVFAGFAAAVCRSGLDSPSFGRKQPRARHTAFEPFKGAP